MRAGRTAVVGVAALIALAGCSGGGDDDAGTGGTGTTTEETTVPDTTEETTEPDDTAGSDDTTDTETAGGEVGIDVATTSLGDVLVDDQGMALYMFDPDEQGASTCYDDCAVAWPPLLVEGEAAVVDGLDESLVGTVERDDGTMQVTFNGWPLYYWQNDAAPGDVTGQAVNEVWWVVGPDGEPIRTAPEGES